jgi:hypothetical protein
MNSSFLKKFAVFVVSLVVILSYQNCSKVQLASVGTPDGTLKSTGVAVQVDDGKSAAEPVAVIPEEIKSLPPEQQAKEMARILCEDFLNVSNIGRVDLNAQSDMSLVSQTGNITISSPVRNLKIDNVTGNIKIKSAVNVSILKLRGNVSINADNVSSMSDVTGNICLSARSIGTISNGTGNTHVFADTIESVTVQTGNFHVYGAIIKSVKVLRGNICLHDGAQILNMEKVVGNFGPCN